MPQVKKSALERGMVVEHTSQPALVLDHLYSRTESAAIILLGNDGKVVRLNYTGLPKTFETIPNGSARDFHSHLRTTEVVQNSSITRGGTQWMSIGTDPEIFVVNSEGEVIPAFVFLPGKVELNGPQQFYDGFQAEWTTSASTCLGHQTDYVRSGMKAILAAARKIDPAARLSHRSAIDIPLDAGFSPERYQLGCSPSMNAYDEEPILVGSPELLPFRSAGWHMHFCGVSPSPTTPSGTKPIELSKEQIIRIVRLEDAILGIALVSFGRGYHDLRRRRMYGRAGEFRYGKTLEYRVPEVMMGCHPATWNLFWDLGRAVYWIAMREMEFIWDAKVEEVREAINNSDVGLAERILRQNLPVLQGIFNAVYGIGTARSGNASLPINAILNGADSILETPTDIEKNWRLEAKGPGVNGVYDPKRDWASEGYGRQPGTIWRTSEPVLARGEKI